MPHIRTLATALFALIVFSAHITDQTTGQPMPGLSVTASGPSHAHGKTDKHGIVTMKGLKPGAYAIRIESDDVPPQTVHVTLKATTTVVPVHVCSMTLDYHCGGGPTNGGGGGA